MLQCVLCIVLLVLIGQRLAALPSFGMHFPGLLLALAIFALLSSAIPFNTVYIGGGNHVLLLRPSP